MGVYQKFRGDPEKKLFYLLENFLGGINTEFSDDNSNDVDFDSIINFDMDRLGTLNKRGGFGEIMALSQIFAEIPITELPVVFNRTPETPNPEIMNDNIVYAKLLQNDNGCFRALSGFSGERAYAKYQEKYGFQQNRFKLLMIATHTEYDLVTEENINVSNAYYIEVYLPELDEDHPELDTMVINNYKITLPIAFNWDRNLMNIDTIEFYDKIFFTGNENCLVTFDRSASILSSTDFANAFTYSGYSEQISGVTTLTNSAHVPSGLEVRHIGFNVLCDNPMTSINTTGITNDSIQGMFICTTDNIPLLSLPLGKPFILNVIYTGTSSDFTITMKCGDNDLSFTKSTNSTYSRTGLASYNIAFNEVPSGEVEIKIVKDTTSTALEPYYDYYDVEQIDSEAKSVTQLNIGDYGICEMYNRAVYYKDDTIWFSDINNFDYIPNYNYVTLPIEPTDKITKICYFKKGYIIFTKQRIYKMVNAFGESDFAIQPVNMSLGCIAGNTVVPIEDTLYFVSARGLYALKSSTFVEGFENVKELDLKIKKLTSDFTRFDEELARPSIRYNGINERAYATRYKDKYLLFYNNYLDKGDYAASNDLDVLVYQFEIGSFTTYRFKEKPTFLFMVDNAIETFATINEDQLYPDTEDILEYDFEQSSGTTVTDLSGNDRDAIVKGGSITEMKGLTLNGTNSSLKTDITDIDFTNGFNLKVDIENTQTVLNSYPSIPLFQFNNYKNWFPKFSEELSSQSSVRIGTYAKYYLDSVLEYTYEKLSTDTILVSPKLTLTISDNNIYTGNLKYSLIGDNGDEYISETTSSITFNNGYTKVITLPTFIIYTHDIDGNGPYFDETLLFNLEYSVTGIGNFATVLEREFNDNLSFTNLAYGGNSYNNPYYYFYANINGEDGTLTTGIEYYPNADDDITTTTYQLSGTHIYDFNEISRQTIELKYEREGNYIKCSSYVDNEKIEDLGYFPISIFEEIPSKVPNKFELMNVNETCLEGNIYYLEFVINSIISKFNLTEGEGAMAIDTNNRVSLVLYNCEWVNSSAGVVFDGENVYLEIPNLPITIPFNQGFVVEFEGSFANNLNAKIFDFALLYNNDKAENKYGSINCSIDNGNIIFSTNSMNYKSYNISYGDVDITENHKYRFDCVYIGDNTYNVLLTIDEDEEPVLTYTFIGGISNIARTSNFLGRSNTTTDPLLKGNLKNFKISYHMNDESPDQKTSVFEFDIAPTDFGKDMYVEVITKGINMKYPQHMKKLKHIFVKSIGGDKYGEFFFELYADGHLVNDPRIFYVYLDENGTVVYDYTGEKILTLDEVNSVLGNIRLDETKLGEGKYQTKKLVIPKKAKNFSCHLYGDTDDYLSLESFGFVCKLGKVKES